MRIAGRLRMWFDKYRATPAHSACSTAVLLRRALSVWPVQLPQLVYDSSSPSLTSATDCDQLRAWALWVANNSHVGGKARSLTGFVWGSFVGLALSVLLVGSAPC